MKYKRHGEVEIDHTASPGLTSADIAGFDGVPNFFPAVSEGTSHRIKTQKCQHCFEHVMINPMRQRERGHCRYCNKFLCDACAIRFKIEGVCRTKQATIDMLLGSDKRRQA
jgi:hypothetical protein